VCVCVCTYTSDCVEIVYELPLLTNTRKAASETILHKSVAMRNVDWIFIIWGAGPAANGRVRDTGQNVLQSCFQTGNTSSSNPRWFHIPLLVAFLEEDFIRNITLLCGNYKICFNNDN
jgi:hypothetical protein